MSVACATGFVSASHFTTCYRQMFGKTPRAERVRGLGRLSRSRAVPAPRAASGPGAGRLVVRRPEPQALDASPRHHDRVVGAQRKRRGHQRHVPPRHRLKPAAQVPVGGDAAGQDQRAAAGASPEPPQGSLGAVDQHVADRGLEAGAEVGHRPPRPGFGAERQDLVADRGLEPGEREVAAPAAEERPRQIEAGGSPSRASASTAGPPG